MPWKTLCGFPPTTDTMKLRIPNGAWRPDTVITDQDGHEIFVLLDQTNTMRSYEAIFGDLDGRRLVCVKRHLLKPFWKDGFRFCTYRPNWAGQKALKERDVDGKKLYPFSYLQVSPLKGRFHYRESQPNGELGKIRLAAENPWLGFMSVCCTPIVRCGKWTAAFRRTKKRGAPPAVFVNQWENYVEVAPHQDLLAALCMAYVFDRVQCQPMVTVFGQDDDDDEPDDLSIESDPDMDRNLEHDNYQVEMSNMPTHATGTKSRQLAGETLPPEQAPLSSSSSSSRKALLPASSDTRSGRASNNNNNAGPPSQEAPLMAEDASESQFDASSSHSNKLV